MLTTLIFILLLSFLVIIHELGHFFAAKWAKVKVEEFGLGYPPRAFKLFKWNGTDFTLNWIPFGGFVKMEGEDVLIAEEEKKSQNQKMPSKNQTEGPFYAKSKIKRLIIILAGVIVNFAFGILAFTMVFSWSGIPTQVTDARIGVVMASTPASAAGIPENVTIVSVKDGQEVIVTPTIEKAIETIKSKQGRDVTIVTSGPCQGLTCQESAQEFKVRIRTQEETPENEGALGIAFIDVVAVFYPWYEMPFRSALYGTGQAAWLGFKILEALGGMVFDLATKQRLPSEISGPVGIVHQAQQSGLLVSNFLSILTFTGIISVNLAIVNLLPIPALDGGRAFFIFLEQLIGKHHTAKVEPYAHYVGYLFLVFLIIMITIRDFWVVFHS